MNAFGFNHREKLESILTEFGIDKADICLDGSTALYLAGIRSNRDIDFVATTKCRNDLYRRAANRSDCQVLDNGKIMFSSFGKPVDIELTRTGRYEVFGLREDDIIGCNRYHTIVDGYKVIRLELVLSIKFAERRPKDMQDIQAIERSGLIGTGDWDWDLVHALPPWQRPSRTRARGQVVNSNLSSGRRSLLRRGRRSLRRRGIRGTAAHLLASCGRRLGKLRSFAPIARRLSMTSPAARYCWLTASHADILANYYNGEKFVGWDVIVEFAMLSQRLAGFSADPIPPEVARNFQAPANSRDVPCLNTDMRIVAGRRRLVESMLTGDSCTVRLSRGRAAQRECDERWLAQMGFSPSQVEALVSLRHQIFTECGLYFYALVWPSANSHLSGIEAFLQDRANVTGSETLALSDDELRDFMLSIYSIDPTVRQWTIEKKYLQCRSGSNAIKVMKLEVPYPGFVMSRKGYVASRAMQELKMACRREYSERVEAYFYDNVIHVTDNYEHNKHVRCILDRFSGAGDRPALVDELSVRGGDSQEVPIADRVEQHGPR